MMYIVAIPRDIYLIDEPDVYLHPPQAYAAARLLANASSDRQLFLATHNAHFLRGLLDEAKERVVLIRLDRNGGSQSVNAIDLALFDEPSAGPLLKFTPVLESAFYRTVVVCENEADCLFYRALLERLGKIGPSSPVFWLSAHGKQNVRNVTALLNNLGVRALSIVDFDVINDEAVLKSLVKAHGGDWDTFRTDFDLMQRSVAEKKPSLAAAEVAAEVLKIMEPLRAAQGLFPTSAKDQIREIFRRASPWREVKESGLAALAKGQVAQAAQRVLANLADIGILVVPVGEMESFCRTIEGDGIKWVEQVLKKDLGTDPELAEARSFADRVAAKLQQ
jgi:hypothetical protein